MGRDLLHKPFVPHIPGEEDEKDIKLKKKTDIEKVQSKANTSLKDFKLPAGLRAKGRDLGTVGEQSAVHNTSEQLETDKNSKTSKTYKHQYFNKDSSGLSTKNLGNSTSKAVRGSDEVVDLKKVVLVPSDSIDNPEASIVKSLLKKMGIDKAFNSGLEDALGSLGQWAQDKERTVEDILAKQNQLEEMVETRKIALQKIQNKMHAKPSLLHMNNTIERAITIDGKGMDNPQNLIADSKQMIDASKGHATKMQKHLNKMVNTEPLIIKFEPRKG